MTSSSSDSAGGHPILSRRSFAATLGGACAARVLRASPSRTNAVFILTDDQGAWARNSPQCADIYTPNLSRLARDGASFTDAFACTPVCSPSRATYLTGRLPCHHGIQDFLMTETRSLLEGQPTYSQMLADNGYTLGLCGKWHMGQDEIRQAGFSYWSTVPGGGGTYRDAVFVKNGKRVKTDGFKDNFVCNDALEFLEQNRNRPFFLYVPFFSPHIPYDFQPERYRDRYRGSAFSCFPDLPMHPNHALVLNGKPMNTLKDHHNPDSKLGYSALLSALDDNIGRIVQKIEDLGLRKNTLIVFSSDQGHCSGHKGLWGKGNSTVPFNFYEESVRVPLIWNHPGRIRSGQVLSPMVSSYDFFPTILDYLGIRAPRDPKRVGNSYATFLQGKSPRWPEAVYFEYGYSRAVRTRTMKYIERCGEWPSELYDLKADTEEKQDRISDPAFAARLKELRAGLHSFFERAGAPKLEDWRSTTRQVLPEYGR